MYLKIINPNVLKNEFEDKVEKETNRIEEEEYPNEVSLNRKIEQKEDELVKLRDKKKWFLEEVKITWNDNSITSERAISISFDDEKINIEGNGEMVVIPLKKIKKIVFSKTLLKIKTNWNWNFKSYNDSTSDGSVSTPIQVWYKSTSTQGRADTSLSD